ncbi:MAG: hypothetical protein AAGI27_13400 [Pseudomonadota bacterium]
MVRLLILALLPMSALADSRQNHALRVGVELVAAHQDASESWLDGGLGKLASTGSGFEAQSAFLDYEGRLSDTLSFMLAAEAYNDSAGRAFDVTEAFFEWRPIPSNEYRMRVRGGVFFPRLSMENTESGWRSPFSDSFSAINTWIGEELRTLGAEVDVSRRVQLAGRFAEVGVFASVFAANDPAGSLLAWRGWALHARQTRLDDALPLAVLPAFADGAPFQAQADYVRPFRETDDAAGFHTGVRLRFGAQLAVEASHYDNRAEPESIENGQYGWATRFDHIGLRARLPGRLTLISQWMAGTSEMGPFANNWHAADIAFDSYFVLLSRNFGDASLTARYDDFEVRDRDVTPLDDNNEDGSSLTVSLRYAFSRQVSLGGEWQDIRSDRPARNVLLTPAEQNERRLSLTLRASFSL